MHLQHSNIAPNIQLIKWNIQIRHAKFTYNIRTCTLNKQLFNSNCHFGDSTFNSTFHSNIWLFNWNILYEHSMQTFNSYIRIGNSTINSNIRLVNLKIQYQHSIRTLDSNIQFEHSIWTFNSNIQFEHSIRTFNSNIQFEHSVRTFNSNIHLEHSIRTFSANTTLAWFPGSSDQHPGSLLIKKRERGVRYPEVVRVAYEIFQRFQWFPTIF